MLIVFGVGGAAGNFIAGHSVNVSLRGSFVVGCSGLVGSLLLLLAIGNGRPGALVALAAWGLSRGVVQLCQVNMTLDAAPETFEAAMSLNTMAYNTSIALGAMFGGLFADRLSISSVMWFGVILTGASLVVVLSLRQGDTRERATSA